MQNARTFSMQQLHIIQNGSQSYCSCRPADNRRSLTVSAKSPLASLTQRLKLPKKPQIDQKLEQIITDPEFYFFFPFFPLGPFFYRKTIRTEVVKGQIWCFEQPQNLGGSSVTINVRMTVVKLSNGKLWVHAPIAPTKQCIKLVKELGQVEHIVLGTFAIEHKVFLGPFSSKFPKAKVYVAPGLWSWPIDLPLPFIGIYRTQELSEDIDYEWKQDIDINIFSPPPVGIGPYFEVAFLHRRSKSLIITDALIKIPPTPVLTVAPSQLLDAAKPNPFSPFSPTPPDTPAARERGWARMVLQALYFGPDNLFEPEEGFSAVAGKIIVSPILQVLVFDKIPESTKGWVAELVGWDWVRVIPAHFEGPFECSKLDMVKAFDFLEGEGVSVGGLRGVVGRGKGKGLPEKDMLLLKGLAEGLEAQGTLNKTAE